MRPGQLTAPAAILGAALVLAGTARAEPYFMVRQGAKCSDCHVNVTGGGMRTAFANIHASDILRDLKLLPIPAGVKAFRGDVSPYLSLGSDLRVRNSTIFQDPVDRRGNVPLNEAIRRRTVSNTSSLFQFTGYAKVELWPDMVSLYADESFKGGATNREAMVLVRGFAPWDTYVKAGRFYPTYGLRVWDDDAFVRGRVGFTFQNGDEGAEIGFAPGPFFLATSVTNGSPGDRDVQATVNGYTVVQDVPVVRNVLAGASFARQSDKRWTAAFYAGSNLWRFTYLGEFDLIDDRTVASAARRDQYAAYAELHFLLLDWLNLRGQFDFVKVANRRSQVRYAVGLEPFIDRFLQPRIQYRINNGPRGQQELNQNELLFELHAFF
jgi:hypothetical protein